MQVSQAAHSAELVRSALLQADKEKEVAQERLLEISSLKTQLQQLREEKETDQARLHDMSSLQSQVQQLQKQVGLRAANSRPACPRDTCVARSNM